MWIEESKIRAEEHSCCWGGHADVLRTKVGIVLIYISTRSVPRCYVTCCSLRINSTLLNANSGIASV